MKTLIGIAIALVALFAAAGTVAAHHVDPSPECEQFTVQSEEGFSVTLSHAEFSRTFGPFGPGEWPTTYGPFDIEAGTWDYVFTTPQGEPDASGVVVVEACPRPTPEVTPTPSHPTPSVVGSLPPPSLVPHPTPPQTSVSETVTPDTVTGPVAIILFVIAALVLTAAIERRYR